VRTSYLIMLACSSALMTMATPLYAQETPVGIDPAQASTAAPAVPANTKGNKTSRTADAGAASPDKAANLSEVMVTATKRAESIQSVPVTVTVVSAAQLQNQGLNNIQDLTAAVPALSAQSGQPIALQIRGIGVPQNAQTAEPSVGIVVDGVSLGNAMASAPQLFDVARVEVLEGPQDTLFGRSTSAGVLNITTNAPDPSKAEVIVHADQGSRDSYTHQAVLNLPVSTYSALRLSVADTRQPDTVYNDYQHSWGENRNQSARLRYLWQPTDKLTVNLIADYSRIFEKVGFTDFPVYQSTPGSTLSNLLSLCGLVPTQDNNRTCTDGPSGYTAKSEGLSAQVDYDFGGTTLSSITAVRHLRAGGGGDADSTPVDIVNTNTNNINLRTESQEFRVTSSDNDFLDYVGGLYYYHSTNIYNALEEGEPLLEDGLPILAGQASLTQSRERSYAGYGEATLKFTPTFRGIIGLRYGDDDVSANTVRQLAPGALFPINGLAAINGRIDNKYNSFRLGVQDDLTSNAMGYITFTKGYKGPAVNDQAATNNVPVLVKPEIPIAWEAGLKTTWLDDRIGINGSIYHTHLENFQALYFDPASATFVYGNAPSVTVKGAELSAFGRLTTNFTLNLGAIYNDAKYGNGYFVGCAANFQTAADRCTTVVNPNGSTAKEANASGNPLVGSPKWKVTLNGTYTHALNADLDGFASADGVYTSRIYFDQAYDPTDTTGSHVLLGAKIGVRSHDGRWGVYIYGRNLTDERVPQFRFVTPSGTLLGDSNTYSQTFGADSFRTVGVSFDARF